MLRLRLSPNGGWQAGPMGTGRSAYLCADCQTKINQPDARVAGVFSRAYRRPVSSDHISALRQDILCHQR